MGFLRRIATSHHHYTGHIRPHRETSYATLAFLVVVTALVAGMVGGGANGASPSDPMAISSNYTVQAVVPGPRPTQPAVITSPLNGQTFPTDLVTVEGTCQAGTLVKIFKNGVLAGSVLCTSGGKFSVPIDLLVGVNALTAMSYNTNDQAGPPSPTVTVTLTVAPGGFGFSNELVLQSINYYRGVVPGQKVVWPIEIIGGIPPFAVNVDWGDGTSTLVTRLAAGPFTLEHEYKKVGGYLGSFPLIIRATDTAGHTAYLQLTTIVNDPLASTATTKKKGTIEVGSLMIIWPLLIVLFLIILAFWLGERREKKIMERRMAALA